jgi:hypothetical protein
MTIIEKIISGLTIANAHGGSIQAEHDEVFITMDTSPTEDDKNELENCGWVMHDGMPTCWRRSV